MLLCFIMYGLNFDLCAMERFITARFNIYLFMSCISATVFSSCATKVSSDGISQRPMNNVPDSTLQRSAAPLLQDVPESPLAVHSCRQAFAVNDFLPIERKVDWSSFPIPSSHIVVVDTTKWSSEGFFIPSAEQIENAKKSIMNYLHRRSDRHKLTRNFESKPEQLEQVIDRLQYYYLQILGIVGEKSRNIEFSFALGIPPNPCGMEPGPRVENWKSGWFVRGGGAAYWAVSYDPDSNEVKSLSINSPR